jgi:lysophospholipase L1-like esterase
LEIPGGAARTHAPRSRRAQLAVAFALIAAFVVALELGFRLVFAIAGGNSERLDAATPYFLGERLACLEPWPYVGYRFAPGAHPRASDDGFLSTHPIAKARTEPAIRIAFVGASTTLAASDAGYDGSFPVIVERLASRVGLPVESMSCGAPGWSSAENLVNYVLTVQDYAPDWVVIHQGAGDVQPLLYPDFRSDYGHYRRPLVLPSPGAFEAFFVRHSRLYTWLLLQRPDVPKDLTAATTRPLPPGEPRVAREGIAAFLRNTETLVDVAQARGARVLLTTESHARRPPASDAQAAFARTMDDFAAGVRDLAKRRGLPLADTDAALAARADLFTDGVHVVAAGHRLEARAIARALWRAGLRDDPRPRIDPRLAKRLEK